MQHAIVRLGDYNIPLIGIPFDACQQICDGCKQPFHILEVCVAADGKRCLCSICVLADAPIRLKKRQLTTVA
jgi:hypothetical protein